MNIFKHHNAAVINHDSKDQMNDNDWALAALKVCYAWVAALIANFSDVVLGLTLSQWVQIAALVFTLAQFFFLMRDKWWRDRKQQRGRRRAQNDRSKQANERA